MAAKCKVRKGDLVVAISGSDAGKNPARVLQVIPEDNKALVEGYRLVRKHMRKTQDNPQGGVVDREAPIDISNLKVVQASAKA